MKPSPIAYQGNLHPPFTDQVASLNRASFGTRVKEFLLMVLVAGVVGGICYGLGYLEDLAWLKWTGIVLGGIIFILGIVIKVKAANCPYCDQKFTIVPGKGLPNDGHVVECKHCHEYLVAQDDQLRALTREDAVHVESIQAPTFKDARWPNECICCGLPAVRFDAIDSRKFNAGALLVGTVSMSKAGVSNIPYCAEHSDALRLKIVSDHPRLVFPDLDMRRRYVACNKGKKPFMIKS